MTEADPRHGGATPRRAWILAQLRLHGFLAVSDLAKELRVSSMTVRRDLHVLESSGEVRLVHGGASLSPTALHRTPSPGDELSVARRRVAVRAAALVGPADAIAVDAGPTAFALARALPESFVGSVVTHSVPVLNLLAERTPGPRLIALGGELRADRHAFVGPDAEAALAGLRVRLFFLDPAAVDARGIYAASPAEASLQRALCDVADETVVTATPDVVASSAPARVAPLRRVSWFVSAEPVPEELGAALRAGGVGMLAAEDTCPEG